MSDGRIDPKKFWSEESRKATLEAKLAEHLVQVAGDMLMPSDDIEKACREWSGDIRKGCLQTFMGGHSGEMYEAFTHGMETVCNALDASLTAFVREQVEKAKGAALDPWSGPLGEYRAALGKCEARIAALEADVQSWKKALEDECQKNHEAGGHGAELRTQVRLLEAALEKADEMAISAGMVRDNEESWYNSRIEANLNAYQRARAKTKVTP